MCLVHEEGCENKGDFQVEGGGGEVIRSHVSSSAGPTIPAHVGKGRGQLNIIGQERDGPAGRCKGVFLMKVERGYKAQRFVSQRRSVIRNG